MPDASNWVCLVTGAASGMGAAAAAQLAHPQRRLVLWDIDAGGLGLTTKQAEEAGAEVHAEVVDIADRAAVAAAVAAGAERFGRIDGVLHFAAVFSPVPLEDIDEEVFERVMGANLGGSLWIAQAVAPVMKQHGGGSIVLTSSDSARQGSTVSGPAYASSKGGVIALTRNLAAILGPSGIRVNAIAPGLALTGMSKDWDPAVLEAYVARVPLRRLGTADQMAAAAIALMSDAMSNVTGEILEVNGGAYFD